MEPLSVQSLLRIMLAASPEELLRRLYPSLDVLVEYAKNQGYAVNHHHLLRAIAVDEEVASEVGSEVDGEMPEGGLRRVEMLMFQPPTRAVFSCNLDVQLEVVSEPTKDMFQAHIRPKMRGRNYIDFGDIQAKS